MPLVISKSIKRDNMAPVKGKTRREEDKICILTFPVSALGSVSVLVVQVKLLQFIIVRG